MCFILEGGVDVMDEILYDSLTRYFHALEKQGTMPFQQMVKVLVLAFYKDFLQEDYRGIVTQEDYRLIDRALDCLFGTTCLIPYADYLKMGKLHLGEMTELALRVKALEDTEVVKLIHDLDSAEDDLDSDVMVLAEEG